MKTLRLAALAALAGCTACVDPGIPEPYTTPARWKGTRLKVEALEGTAVATTKPGAVTYEFEEAAWNPFLAATLEDDLHELGAEKADGAVLRIGMSRVLIEERSAGQVSHAEFWIKVAAPCGDREYHGVHESQVGLKDSARRAAADALKALVEDEELKKAFTVEGK